MKFAIFSEHPKMAKVVYLVMSSEDDEEEDRKKILNIEKKNQFLDVPLLSSIFVMIYDDL